MSDRDDKEEEEQEDSCSRRYREQAEEYEWEKKMSGKLHRLYFDMYAIKSDTVGTSTYDSAETTEEKEARIADMLKHIKNTKHIERLVYDYAVPIMKALEELKPEVEKALRERQKNRELR